MLSISVHVLINDNLTGGFPRNSTLFGMTNRGSLEPGLEETHHFFELLWHVLICGLRNVLTYAFICS